MQPARPLRDVFDEVARGDLGAGPAEALAGSGHGDLPDQLVSEAIVSYADTAPVEVAEHLAPFVTVHSAVPVGDAGADLPAGDGLDLLASAPEQLVSDDMTIADDAGDVDLPAPAAGELGFADAADFGFGSGAGGLGIDAAASIDEQAEGVPVEPSPVDDLPAPVESAAEPVYPWVATPDGDDADDANEPVDG